MKLYIELTLHEEITVDTAKDLALHFKENYACIVASEVTTDDGFGRTAPVDLMIERFKDERNTK